MKRFFLATVFFLSCLTLLSCGARRGGGESDALGEGGDDQGGVTQETDWMGGDDGGGDEAMDATDWNEVEGERCFEAGCPCLRGETIACYEGDPNTRGKGLCHDGLRTCGEGNVFSECIGQVLPVEEICDGFDNNCDGEIDAGLRNACGGCGEVPLEQCGNSIDDNCNGEVDEGCECDPGCLCPDPPDPVSPCECHPPTNQPCYGGPPSTMGIGLCRGGLHDCIPQPDGTGRWGPCRGEILPRAECDPGANGQDDDCDGMIDDGCVPDGDGDGFTVPQDCDDSNPEVNPGVAEICDGIDNDCNGLADEGVTNACGGCGTVAEETCNNGHDDDCDGTIDELCNCNPGETQNCYSGPIETLGVGNCRAGLQTCIASPGGEFPRWGSCEGEVAPSLEVCDSLDNDCDGETDERWAVGSNRCGWCSGVEICDGEDNDCDGFADEGLRNACGECLPVPEESQCDGADDDCDGLVDEYLVNSCGECPPADCYEQPYPDPGDCTEAGRLCDGTEPWPDDPTAITLGQSTLTNHLYRGYG